MARYDLPDDAWNLIRPIESCLQPLESMVGHGLVDWSTTALDGIGIQRHNGSMKRRIATRYDKTARNYLTVVKLGCIRLFYQRLCN